MKQPPPSFHKISEPLPFDFQKYLPFPENWKHVLTSICENFSAHSSQELSNYFHKKIEISLLSIEKIPFGRSFSSAASPSFYAVLDLHPLQGAAFLEVSPQIACQAINAMLGSEEAPSFTHSLNSLETAMNRKFFSLLMDQMREAWKPLFDMRFTLLDVVSSLKSPVVGVRVNSPYFYARFDLKWDSVKGNCFFMLPMGIFNLFSQYLDQTPLKEIEGTVDKNQKVDGEKIEVTLHASLGKIRMSGVEFQQLQVGDIVTLEQKINEPIVVEMDRRKVFEAFPGISGINKAIVVRSKR